MKTVSTLRLPESSMSGMWTNVPQDAAPLGVSTDPHGVLVHYLHTPGSPNAPIRIDVVFTGTHVELPLGACPVGMYTTEFGAVMHVFWTHA